MLMKTSRIILLAAAAVLLSACNKEVFPVSGNNDGTAGPIPMTFTADVMQTRTQLAEGNAVHWTAGDQIAVWDEQIVNVFTATSVNGSSAIFEGTALQKDIYTAFYPYSNLGYEGINHSSIRFILPEEQTAVAGSFAPDVAPSWAQAKDGSTSFHFQNLCALVKFTAGADMTGEGTFTIIGGKATENLAGEVIFYIDDGSLTFTEDLAYTYKHITLKGNFEAGESYYIVIVPGTLPDGFSLLYEDSENRLYRKATARSVILTAGHILDLGTLSLSDDFEKAAYKEIYENIEGGTGTVNADGTVNLSDADLSALASLTEMKLENDPSLSQGLTSLGGIGYCTGLTELVCYGNSLTNLDLGHLTGLTYLDCSGNFTEHLDISGLRSLTYLNCRFNKLAQLDLTNLPELTYLDCQLNQLAALDLSNQTKLEFLYCNNNNLTELDITNLPDLSVLLCGNQDIGENNLMRLTLTEAQKDYWYSTWKSDENNNRVFLEIDNNQ